MCSPQPAACRMCGRMVGWPLDCMALPLPGGAPAQGVCFVALAVSRALNVWPCAALVNLGRPRELRIPQSHQVMLWWSGLRGAMAFAIALEAAEAVPGARRTLRDPACSLPPAPAAAKRRPGLAWRMHASAAPLPRPCPADPAQGSLMLAATYCIILATVLINGGACTWLLGRLGLKAARGSGHTFYRWACAARGLAASARGLQPCPARHRPRSPLPADPTVAPQPGSRPGCRGGWRHRRHV